MKISELIQILLLENDIVVLPELGAFETKHISAKINKTTGEIQPPSKTVNFNPSNTKDDKIILNHLKENMGLSESDASKQIKDFIKATQAKLKMKDNIIFKEVGTLYLDQNNKICLKDEAKDSLLTDNYGMTTVKIPQKKTQPTQKVTVLPKKAPKSKKSNKTLKRILIALPFIALIVLIAVFYKQIWNFSNNFAQNLFNKSEITDTTNVNNTDNNDVVIIDSTETDTNLTIDSTETNNQTETPPDSKTDTEILENSNVHKVTPDNLGSSYKKYYLIVGSFEYKSFANDRVNEMKKIGYSSCEILFRDNRHRVSIGGFNDINKAIQLYNEFIKTHNKNEIWLLRNEK